MPSIMGCLWGRDKCPEPETKIVKTSHPGLIRRVQMQVTPQLGWTLYTAVSRKVVLQTEKSLRDNAERYYG